jgi:cytoskeleton protein RodZ
MSDEISGSEPSTEYEQKPSEALTAGGLIRQARESSGLHIAALAVSLKVPVKKLEALEADQFDLLHDAVFVRALASSVCRSLRMDPALVLAKLPQSVTPVLASETSINTPFQTSTNVKGLALGVRLRHPLVLAVLALLVGAVIVGFLPELQKVVDGSWESRSDRPRAAVAPTAPVSVVAPQAPVVPASGAAADAAAGLVLENVPREPAASASAAAAVVPISRAASAPSAVIASPSESTALANAVVAFKARASSWVEVTDARGVVVLRRTLQAGESVAASGALPLQSLIGRADAVEVQVRGKAFDLSAVSKENVARFEVK